MREILDENESLILKTVCFCIPKTLNAKYFFMDNRILITTSNYLEGYRVTKQLGLVRGITVRSRSVLGNMAGGFLSIFGGKNSIYTELCERTREDALQLMI